MLCIGLTMMGADDDLKKWKETITQASKCVNDMKMQLSNVTQNHGRLEIRLDLQDIHDLKSIYQDLMKNMQDIREMCSKPFPS